MPIEELAEFVNALDKSGELKRVKTQVDTNLEISEILSRVMYSNGPAVLFENVKNYDMPVLGNAFGSMKRLEIGLETSDFTEIGQRIVDMTKMDIPTGIFEKIRKLPELSKMTDIAPKLQKNGPVTEVFEDSPSFERIPILKTWPKDAGKFITFGLVATKHPETGVRNLGVYRMQILDKTHALMHWQKHKRGAHHYDIKKDSGSKIQVAVVIGSDPATVFSAVAPVPEGLDKYVFAGITKKTGIKTVKCKTIDLEVPANAELVLEGYVDPSDIRMEGPFGEWPGYYASAQRAEPFVRVKAVYYRNDPIICGAAPFKQTIHGMYRSCLRAATVWNGMEQAGVPDIRGVYLPPPAQRFMIVVAIKQRYPGHAKQAALVACQCHAGAYLGRYVVVVDEDIDITDLNEVVWAIATRSDPATSVDILRRTWSGPLDPIIPPGQKGHNSRMIIEATRPYEWRDRFPNVSQISNETRKQFSLKWEKQLAAVQARHAQPPGKRD